jgi:hypothetical protein
LLPFMIIFVIYVFLIIINLYKWLVRLTLL